MMEDVRSVCRLCRCDNSISTDIFLVDFRTGYTVVNVIEDLFRIEVKDKDGFPRRICPTCHEKLIGFQDFKELCLQSIAAFEEELASREVPRVFHDDSLEDGAIASSLPVTIKTEVDELEQWEDPVCEIKAEISSSSNLNPLINVDEEPGDSFKDTEDADSLENTEKGNERLNFGPIENEDQNREDKGNETSFRSERVRKTYARHGIKKKVDLSIGKWKKKLAGILKVGLSMNVNASPLENLCRPLKRDIDDLDQWGNPISDDRSQSDTIPVSKVIIEENIIPEENVIIHPVMPSNSQFIRDETQKDTSSKPFPSSISVIKEAHINADKNVNSFDELPSCFQFMTDDYTSSNSSSNFLSCRDNPDDEGHSDDDELDFGSAFMRSAFYEAIRSNPNHQGQLVSLGETKPFFLPGDYVRSGFVQKLASSRGHLMQKNQRGGHIDYSAKCKILALEKSLTVGEVAYCVGVHPRTVRRWIANYKLGGQEGLKRRPGTGKWKVTTPEEDKALIEYIRDHPNSTAKEAKQATNYSASLNTIKRRAREEGLFCGAQKTRVQPIQNLKSRSKP